MQEITGLEIIFENCEQFFVKADDIKELKCDFYFIKDHLLPDIFFEYNIRPNYLSLKLSNCIDKRLLNRLQEYKNITYMQIISETGSTYIKVPYCDLDESNRFKYYLKKLSYLFKETIFFGENIYQKNKYCTDGVEIIIEKK